MFQFSIFQFFHSYDIFVMFWGIYKSIWTEILKPLWFSGVSGGHGFYYEIMMLIVGWAGVVGGHVELPPSSEQPGSTSSFVPVRQEPALRSSSHFGRNGGKVCGGADMITRRGPSELSAEVPLHRINFHKSSGHQHMRSQTSDRHRGMASRLRSRAEGTICPTA